MASVQSLVWRTPIRRAICLDTDPRRAISPRHRWPWPADAYTLGDCRADGNAGVLENRRARADLFRLGSLPASRAIRHVHGFELFPLVHFLGVEPDPGIPADKTLGRTTAECSRDAVFHLYH